MFLNLNTYLLTIVLCFLMIKFNNAELNCKTHQETIRDFYVESSVAVGMGTTLKCLFGSTGKLVNLKWYVNDTEFYRYEPSDRTRSHVKKFNVKGVKIDESQTQFDATKGSIIRLANLTYLSTGVYKCELTTEPCFLTTEKKKQLIVYPSRRRFMPFGLNSSSSKLINNLIIWFILIYKLCFNKNYIT